jgi:hypothetical protein
MENDEGGMSPELKSALILYTQYLRMVKVALDFKEAGMLRLTIIKTITAGGTVSLVRTDNGLEFRVQSKEKKRNGISKPRTRQSKASTSARPTQDRN